MEQPNMDHRQNANRRSHIHERSTKSNKNRNQHPDLTTSANLISLDPGYIDNNPSDNSMNCSITVPTSADIQINQTATGTPQTNQQITYTITATNNGPDTANNIKITDNLPTGLTNIIITPSTGTYTNGIWTIPTLTNGQTATLTITATITATQGT